MSEDLIVRHCAPTLAGLKTGNMFTACEASLSGKKIALFGSYDWGDGEWMRNWEARCKSAGANLACDFVICHLEPDEEGKEACRKLGAALA